MAKRGWRPRSTSATRRPRLSSASAVERSGEARSDDGDVGHRCGSSGARVMRWQARSCGPRTRRPAATDWSRFMAWRRSRRAARQSGARREALEVPEIDEHPSTAARVRQCEREAALDVFEARRAEPSGRSQRVDRAVARPRRHQRHDRRAAGKGGVDRAQQPRVLLVVTERTAARSAERRAAPRRDRASALAACAKRSSVNRLFNRSSATGCAVSRPIATSSCGASVRRSAVAIERREQPIHARADQRGM